MPVLLGPIVDDKNLIEVLVDQDLSVLFKAQFVAVLLAAQSKPEAPAHERCVGFI